MIEITQHIFKEEMLAEGLMKKHAGYNILDNLWTFGICQTKETTLSTMVYAKQRQKDISVIEKQYLYQVCL